MKKLFTTIVLLSLVVLNVVGQNDSLHHKKFERKRAFGAQYFYLNNFVSNPSNYPISQMLYIGISNPMTDYKERLYQNAFFCTNFFQGIEINYYDKIGFRHSLGYSFLEKDKTHNWSINISQGFTNSVNMNYQFSYSFFQNHRIFIYPFIAAKEDLTVKILKDELYPWDHHEDIFTIKDNSGLLLTQLPVGFLIDLKYFTCSLSASFNLLAVIIGNNQFDPPAGYGEFTHEKINYFKVQSIIDLIEEKYFLQNLRVSVGIKI
jgi:hypothetical protein